jgi:hypothetical protein
MSIISSPPTAAVLTDEELQAREDRFCSKVFSGFGQATFAERTLPTQDKVRVRFWLKNYTRQAYHPPQFDYLKRLPRQDQPNAVAKQSVQTDEILEISPALVLPYPLERDSPWASMGIFCDDWDEEQKKNLVQLRESGAFRMRVRTEKTEQLKYDNLQQLEDAVILPVAGTIAMVRKVGREADSNCRIEIVASTSFDEESEDDQGSAGLVLKLIATADILAGEELRLDLPVSSSWSEKVHLSQILTATGQPLPKHIVDTRDYAPTRLQGSSSDESGKDEL